MTSRLPRGSLSRSVVLDAALAVIDRVGLDGLTMRGLAREMGRPPMSLYAHFHSKRDLLDHAFERLVRRLFTIYHHSTWQAEFEGACRHMRRVLLEHPHWVALLTRVRVPVSALDIYDRLLGLMDKDGFRHEAAMFAFSSILSHALGSVLFERMMGGSPPIPKQRLELIKGMMAHRPRGTYRHVAATSKKFDQWTFDAVFDIGMHALIAGLDERAPRRRRRAHTA